MKRHAHILPTLLSPMRNVVFGWLLVALLEAGCYLWLATAIYQRQATGWVLLLALLAVICTVLVGKAGFFAGASLIQRLYQLVAVKLQNLQLDWFVPAHRTLLAMLVSQDIPGLMKIPAHQLPQYLYAPLLPLLLLGGTGWLAGLGTMAWLSLLLVLAFGCHLLAQRSLMRVDAKRAQARHRELQQDLQLTEQLELLRTAAGFARASAALEQSWQQQEQALAQTNRAAAVATGLNLLATALPIAGFSLLLQQSTYSSFEQLALLLLAMRASAVLESLALTALTLNDLKATLERLQLLLQAPVHVRPKLTQSSAITPTNSSLALRQVAVGSRQQPITLQLKPGQTLLLKGSSGCGKTTLLRQIAGFLPTSSGEIRLGNIKVDALNWSQLRQLLAYVPQQPVIFSGTIASNIRCAAANASDEQVAAVARLALLGPLLDRSPEGIYQSVGLDGAALSGGEAQRLTIARALLQATPMLLLDEATSALDEESERQLAQNLRQLKVMLVLVTHRQTEIWRADQVLDLSAAAQH